MTQTAECIQNTSFMCFLHQQRTATSGRLLTKYSFSQTRHYSLLWGNVPRNALFQHMAVTVILQLFTYIWEHLQSGQWKYFSACLRQHLHRAARPELGGIKGSALILQPYSYMCVFVCTFCSSVTYWATMNADSVVKLLGAAATWEYILSTSLEHWRYTSPSVPLKIMIKVNSMTY